MDGLRFQRVNLSMANLFRAVVTLLFAAHVFFMYAHVREMGSGFGFDAGTMTVGLAFSLVMLVPFIWVYWIADVPQIMTKHVLPKRRWAKGGCPACGYSREGLTAAMCPECGAELIKPREYRFSLSTIGRFVLLVLIAWLGGCFVVEGLALYDEHLFRREVEMRRAQGLTDAYWRQRIWPMGNSSLGYVNGGQFISTD